MRRRRAARAGAWVGRSVLWSGLGLAAGLLVAVGIPPLVGSPSLTVMSGSMEPAVSTGDVVVNQMISPLAARRGDIVSFRDPDDQDRMITHRLRRIKAVGSTVELETKGDANNTVERWAMPAHERIGRVIYRVPRVGYFFFWARSPAGRLALLALPCLVLGAFTLFVLWRRPRLPQATHSAVLAIAPGVFRAAYRLNLSRSCGGQAPDTLRARSGPFPLGWR